MKKKKKKEKTGKILEVRLTMAFFTFFGLLLEERDWRDIV